MHNDLKWLVIPGGPGLSNTYLKHTLPAAFSDYNLYFYDAYGSPESGKKDVTVEEMVEQVDQKTSELRANGEYGLITHSFGNYLALRLLEKKDSQLKALIMINPVPFTYKDWKTSLEDIIKKVPSKILSQLDELSLDPEQGETLFRLIYPYYVGDASSDLPMSVPFDTAACNLITARVNDFSDLNLISNSNLPMVRIVGEADPFYKNKNIMTNNTLVLKKVGHYPFFEDLTQFTEAVERAGEFLCQETHKTTATKFF